MALGILCAYGVLLRLGRGRGFSPDRLGNLVAGLVLAGLAGARLFFVVEHWDQYAGDPAAALRLWEGGLMFYGSIVVAGLALVAWCAARREPMLPMLDLFAVVVPLGQAFGRVGCLMNGCCYGRPSQSALALAYPAGSIPWAEQIRAGLLPLDAPASLPCLPSQLFEAAGCLLLFFALLALYRRLNPPTALPPRDAPRPWAGAALAAYLALYGALRFVVETTRADERAHPFGSPFTISQTIGLGAIALALALLAVLARRRRAAAARRPDDARAGVTLTEVLLATFILGVCLVGIMQGLSACVGVFHASTFVKEASNVLARGDAEHPLVVSGDPEDDLAVAADGSLVEGWTYERECLEDEDEDGLYLVRTTVRQGRGGPGNERVYERLVWAPAAGTGGAP